MDYNVTYREKDGSIQAIVSYKKGGKWRQKAQQGFKKKKLAKTWADGIVDDLKEEAEKNLELNEEYKGLTFEKFKEMFLSRQKRYLEPNTLKVFKLALLYCKDLDSLPIDQIGTIDIQGCIDKMIDNKLLLSTMKTYVKKIHVMFESAISPYKIISDNPTDMKSLKLVAEKEDKGEKLKALSEAEFQKLLGKIKNPKYYIATLLAGNVGLRAGEIKGITRNNIHSIEIKIDKQWKKNHDGKWEFGKLKTPNSYRTVPISPKTYKKIKEYENRFPTDIYNKLLINSNNLDSFIRNYYKKLGFDISIHDLRHTYATKLLANNVDYETIALYMGDDVKTVIETYSHINKDMSKRGRSIINNHF